MTRKKLWFSVLFACGVYASPGTASDLPPIPENETIEMSEEEQKKLTTDFLKFLQETVAKENATAKMQVQDEFEEKRDPKVLADLLKQLNDLEGLDEIKRKVSLVIAQKTINEELEKRGLRKTVPINLNLQFVGPPGTGKTTVARLYGKILKEIDLLENGEFHEFRRADLLGQYLGTATTMTQACFEKSVGGVMFIDEFHNFLNSKDAKDNDPYGKEALGTLVGLMTDEIKGRQVVVIVAGYEQGMNNVMHQDEGLMSRIPERIVFGTLTDTQLVSIFKKKAKASDYEVMGKIDKELDARIKRAKKVLGIGFGNGRYVNFLFTQAVENQMLRLAKLIKIGVNLTDDDFRWISPDDLPPLMDLPKVEEEGSMSDEVRMRMYI